jgi:rare lipoprotein A
MQTRHILLLVILTLLGACSSGRYRHANDSIPSRLPNQAELKDATPRAENYSRGGNKNYQVRGINYQVLLSAENFEEIGVASWYGRKFHGHLTSNGEIYDMYAMSAAHKNLPLPTYLKVTNMINNKSVIVRVNDRGPFHQKRIIDLSYSAAYKLDMLKTGTANVKITSITNFDKKNSKLVNLKKPLTDSQLNIPMKGKYIQVFATGKLELAKKITTILSTKYSQPINYPIKNNIYRIQIGPISNSETINKLLLELKQGNYPNAYLRSI